MLLALKALSTVSAYDSSWEVKFLEIMGFAMTNMRDLEFLEWLSANFYESGHRMVTSHFFQAVAQLEDFLIVQWLHDLGFVFAEARWIDVAAEAGNLKLVCFFLDTRDTSCSSEVVDNAAGSGNLKLVQFLYGMDDNTGC